MSRICKQLDGQVHAFRTRPLSGDYPYLILDATFEKVRENGRVVSMAVVIAVGVRSTGERDVLGTDVGPAVEASFGPFEDVTPSPGAPRVDDAWLLTGGQ